MTSVPIESLPTVSVQIEFDVEIQLPAVQARAEGAAYARQRRPWSIAVRFDGDRSEGWLGSDVLPLPAASAFAVDAAALRSVGFGPVNELALALWSLERAELPKRVLFAVSTSFLLETAKLRAFRVLQPETELWAVGDIRNLSSNDIASNGIRTTLQTVAAIWGTADAVCILPNNAPIHAFMDPEAARLAANIGRMLREESYADQIPDPTAGSVLLDTAVSRLVESAIRRKDEFNATGAQTQDTLLAHESVTRLRMRDVAWWAARTQREKP